MTTYALIDLSTGIVSNTFVLDDPSGWPVPDGFIIVETDVAGIGWSYADGVFSPPPPDPQTIEQLAASARNERDQLLKSVYDPGINMALRALRMSTTPEEQSYAEGKIVELDNYAQALEDVPEQSGFPQTINWPVMPIK